MFIGVDHGTTAIRFAGIEEEKEKKDDTDGDSVRIFEIDREKAANISYEDVLKEIKNGLNIKKKKIKLIALTYSMGDAFATIKSIKEIKGRGVVSEKSGIFVGGGTKVFDAIKESEIPTILIPGIHRKSKNIDRRMKFFSHCASSEKVGIAYYIHKKGYNDFIFSDISSNTVTMAVARGIIIGAIDACVFAPGLYQGPLDLQLIRDVDNRKISANAAFSSAGVLNKPSFSQKRHLQERNTFDIVSLFASMEIAAMQLFMNDYSASKSDKHEYEVFLTGLGGEKEEVKKRIDKHLGLKTKTLTRYSAAIGCAEIAKDIFYGKKNILGIEVEAEEVGNERRIV